MSGLRQLGHDTLDYRPMHVGQAEIATSIPIGQSFVIETQLGVSKATILRHIGDGELQAVDMRKKGSSRPLFRISESSIQALISDRRIHNEYVLPRSINRNLKPKRKHF